MISIVLAALVFFATALSAQFSGFGPTADGASLYFATNYAQRNTGQPDYGKIFVIDGKGLRPYAIRPRDAGPDVISYYATSAPSVSSDGQVVAYAGTRDCFLGRQCVGVHYTQTTFTGVPGKGDVTLFGRAYVSRNGRYGHVYQSDSLDSGTVGLWDLQTGTQIFHSSYSGGNPQSVADDGTTVFANSGLALFRNGQFEYVSLANEAAAYAVINRAGTSVIYISRWVEPDAAYSRLRIFDIASRSVRTLAEGFGDVYQPSFSDDGRQVLFLSTARFSGASNYGPAQAFLLTLDGSVPRQLTADPAGVQSAVLSGNGRVAFLFTYAGRLLRVSLDAAGPPTELILRTPFCCSGFAAAAGSLYTMTGAGLHDSSGNPPTLSFNGRPVALVSSSPSQLTFVVPWELADQTATMSIGLTSDSSFEIPASVTQSDFHPLSRNPQFFPIPPEYGTQGGYGFPFAKAAHQNFEGLITQDSPARRGESVHLYATGLGPVDATGRVTQPFTCSIPTRVVNQDAPVLYAGLAPGIPGIYQVDLRIPPDLPADLSYPTIIELVCGSFGAGSSPAVTTLPLSPP